MASPAFSGCPAPTSSAPTSFPKSRPGRGRTGAKHPLRDQLTRLPTYATWHVGFVKFFRRQQEL